MLDANARFDLTGKVALVTMDAFKKRASADIPLGRGGEADEIVGAALYSASGASSFTTGAVLGVHGGVA